MWVLGYVQKEIIKLNEKLEGADIYLDTFKFLKNHDENVKVLNQYALSKKFKEKPKERESKDYGDDDYLNY